MPVPPALAALSVTFDVPVVCGVPEITPVMVLTARPAGRPEAPKLVGLLVAMIAYVKLEPTTPLALVVLVMTGAGGGAG